MTLNKRQCSQLLAIQRLTVSSFKSTRLFRTKRAFEAVYGSEQ